jgi:tetratricopeptide (TPR) repeat protein
MSKIFESGISIAVALITLVLCVKWYGKSGEIEPLIGIIASVGLLLTAVVYRVFPKKKEDMVQPNVEQKQNAIEQSIVTAGQNLVAGNENNINQTFITYEGDRKIPTILTAPTASVPATYLGREQELHDIRALLKSHSTIALINAEGGMGKTTIAAKYWAEYADQYKHKAWLFCDSGILSAIRNQLPEPLGIIELMNTYANEPNKQVEVIKNHLATLDKDCLLVLDNANEAEHITGFLKQMTGLGWHVLMTSRCLNVLSDRLNEYQIKSLPPEQAKKLFKDNYTEDSPEFDALLDRFLHAVGYNTLCIEIFSKNLRAGGGGTWGYSFADFLKQFEKTGLVLGENSFTIVVDHATNVKSQAQTSDEIIEQLYSFATLAQEETNLLIQFALLPAENHAGDVLINLLTAENNRALKRRLDSLAQKGWLATDATSYRISPVVQKIVLHKHADIRWELGQPMVEKLQEIFQAQGLHVKNIETAGPYASLVFGLIENLDKANKDIAHLLNQLWIYYYATGNLVQAFYSAERMQEVSEKYGDKYYLSISYEKLGNTHKTLGILDLALKYYEGYKQLMEEFYAANPTNVSYKNGLAISYSKLGNTHSNLGNFYIASKYYEENLRLSEELYAAYPTNAFYKYGLATTYGRLGLTHTTLGNLDVALKYCEDETKLFKELSDDYSTNFDYKQGLAISYSTLGDMHMTLGNLELALKYYEDFNRLFEELYAAYPTNVSFKNGLAVSYHELGCFSRDHQQDKVKARAYFKETEALLLELVRDAPQFVKFQRDLAEVQDDLVDLH